MDTEKFVKLLNSLLMCIINVGNIFFLEVFTCGIFHKFDLILNTKIRVLNRT